jgi:aspartyl-tRNA(Asn)/glutamyl-tRNA(Gln) amidotransferase subunit B
MGTKDPTAGTSLEAVIGLEVHVQLKTRSKMFCACENRFGAEPNSLTCPVCLGLPGSLPVVNRAAVESAVRVGLSCGSRIALYTKFDRKNYFYPDLPKNYQISQFDLPIAEGGAVPIHMDGVRRSIGLVRVHLEEDAGKNIHVAGKPESWVDLNRCGVPLLEIVSCPEMHTPEEAGAYLRMLRLMLLYLGVSDCNMEEGSLRCDSNVSIRPRGSAVLETRAEIKNLNSFTNVENAIGHEISRQMKLRAEGRPVVQQTLLYDAERDETRVLRSKEEAHDYRYFPDPDLAPLHLDPAWIEGLRAGLPEMPIARIERFQEALGLPKYQAEVLGRDKEAADYFEEALRSYPGAQDLANFILNIVLEDVNSRGVSIRELGLSPSRLASLLRAMEAGLVSRPRARDLYRAMLSRDAPVEEIVASQGLGQISEEGELRRAVAEALEAHPSAVEDVKNGKKNSVNFLMGQVMRRTRGQGNPAVIVKLIEESLGA